jgi:hypothetical protein
MKKAEIPLLKVEMNEKKNPRASTTEDGEVLDDELKMTKKKKMMMMMERESEE